MASQSSFLGITEGQSGPGLPPTPGPEHKDWKLNQLRVSNAWPRAYHCKRPRENMWVRTANPYPSPRPGVLKQSPCSSPSQRLPYSEMPREKQGTHTACCDYQQRL
jgi:hypothetical protein